MISRRHARHFATLVRMTSSLARRSTHAALLCSVVGLALLGCDSDSAPPANQDDCARDPEKCEGDKDDTGDERPVPPKGDAGGGPKTCDYYPDQDGDGLGDPGTQPDRCPGLLSADNADDPEPTCKTNDTDECGVCGGKGPSTWYADGNGDGTGDWANQTSMACTQPTGYVQKPPAALRAGCVLAAEPGCVESATCDKDCTEPVCGDALVNASAGETCEQDPKKRDPSLFASCLDCRANPNWRQVIPQDAGERVRGLCVTASDEVYLATSSGKLAKYDLDGKRQWEVTTARIAHIACHAAHGVAVVGEAGPWMQRWLPNGTPAHTLRSVSEFDVGKRVAIRDDGAVAVASVSNSDDAHVTLFSAAGDALSGGPQEYVRAGDPIALRYPASGVPHLLTHRNSGSESQPYAELRHFQVGGGMLGASQNFTMVEPSDALILDDLSAVVVGRLITFSEQSFLQHFSTTHQQDWSVKIDDLADRCVARSSGGVIVARRDSLYHMRLSEVSLQGKPVRELYTSLSYDAVGLAQASDRSVLVAGSHAHDASLFLSRLFFDQLASSKPLLPNGGACKFGPECQSRQCLDNKCEAAEIGVNQMCRRDENCSSRACIAVFCRASNLSPGATCMDPRQCTSGKCTAARCE